MAKNLLINLVGRVLNTPLMITEAKLSAILDVLGPRIGLEVSQGELDAIADFSVPKRYRQESDDGIGLIPIYDTLVYRAAGLDALSGDHLRGYRQKLKAVKTDFEGWPSASSTAGSSPAPRGTEDFKENCGPHAQSY